jgi:hypothetical protein
VTKEIQKYADPAMFTAAPMEHTANGVLPKVHLLWMTPDPLGAVAAANTMYIGQPVFSLAGITDDQRKQALDDMQKTHLQAPLEFIKLHFIIEGVDRAFTHQLVRQRTAVYAQESLRFAVKEDLAADCTLPPSLMGLPADDPRRMVWDSALSQIENSYNMLISAGLPAEEARGLMPTAIGTRLHYCTDMRNLIGHAGNRLCTQAQFHWRVVFLKIVEAIRNYTPDLSWMGEEGMERYDNAYIALARWESKYRWQFEAIANSNFFRPICYQTGKCEFRGSADRACTIRSRVDAFHEHGVPSDLWGPDQIVVIKDQSEEGLDGFSLDSIDPAEWLMDPTAAIAKDTQ